MQIDNKVYWLKKDGTLHTEQCLDNLQVLAAGLKTGARNIPTLVVTVAHVAEGDQLRLHIEGQLATERVSLPVDPNHNNGPQTLHVQPRTDRTVTAVEQLRDGYASGRVKVGWLEELR